MRTVITNFGTAGDLRPFLALAVELERRGYGPVLAFPPQFQSQVEKLGLPFASVGPDLTGVQERTNRALASVTGPEAMTALFEPIAAALPQAFDELHALAANADLLICGAVQPAGRMIHELTGVPFVSVQLAQFGGGGAAALREAGDRLINPFRRKLGLPALMHPLTTGANSPQLALFALSRHLLAKPRDWPAHYHVTGFFFLDEADRPLDPKLELYLRTGDAPVLFCFGSMAADDPDRQTRVLVESARMAGCRAIIQTFGPRLEPQALDDGVFMAGYLPHEKLMPRVSLVVHHGGAGTTAAVLRAGVPSVFVPHGVLFDQYYFGILARELGVSGGSILLQDLTAERLGEAIALTRSTPTIRDGAARLSDKIRAERGVATAADLIAGFVGRLGLEPLSNPLSRKGQGLSAALLRLRRQRRTIRSETKSHPFHPEGRYPAPCPGRHPSALTRAS